MKIDRNKSWEKILSFLAKDKIHFSFQKTQPNSSDVMVTYEVTKLRTNPTYITIYVNWFLLFATGVIPMGSLIYLNSRIYAKILETRRLRERCKIRSSTTIAMKDMKNGTTNSSPAVSPNAPPPSQHNIQNAKRHSAALKFEKCAILGR